MEKGQNYGITLLHPKEGSTSTTNDIDIVFDLVAVHGLAGDPFVTWTHLKAQQMWLQDILPKVMPHVRTMTFGYNASFTNYAAKQDIRSIAAKLLAELADFRSEAKKSRPIILVCHSLGGIIAKQALLLEPSSEYAKIQNAVHGIIFLATPHRGSSLAAYGRTIANITKFCSPLNPPTALLDALREDSQILVELSAKFAAIASRIQIASFYEMKLTRVGVMKTMVVKESSAVLNLPHEVRIPSNTDHRQIARFPSQQDRNFRPLLKRLEIFEAQITRHLNPEVVEQTKRETAISTLSGLLHSYPAPCSTFKGRQDILDQIGGFFNQHQGERSEQLSFALCGFGGIGKTQVALQYAKNSRMQYTSGSFCLSARSESTIAASLLGICESLGLNEGSDNSAKFKRWLASSEDRKFLLILDNADDLSPDIISACVPNVPWGHVLYTSRDQGIIGTLAQSGLSINLFTQEEAVQVLLQKVGIDDQSEASLDSAEKIVRQFGCLPLAIDQAGAYMKARNKSLSSFQELCSQRQSAILKYKPRSAQYEQTVFTTWDLNFEQVEKTSGDAQKVMLLLCYLDPSNIYEGMLDRGCSPQKRWARDGEVTEILPSASGVGNDVIEIIRDDFRFDGAVEVLKSFSLISVTEHDQTGLRVFSIHPMIQYCASERLAPSTQSHWQAQTLAMVCHAFPPDETLDPFYFSDGITMLPHARRVLNEWSLLPTDDAESSDRHRNIIHLYLSCSRFGKTSWKFEAISQAKTLLHRVEDPYLSALVSGRESSLLRMNDQTESSFEVVQTAVIEYNRHNLGKGLWPEDCRHNAQMGRLLQSQAENLIFLDKLDDAQSELQKWSPIDDATPSSMEKAVQVSIQLTLARLFKVRGNFEEALSLLIPLFQRVECHDIDAGGWRRVLIATIAEIYCELGQPVNAQSILTAELDYMKLTKIQNVNSGLRLQLVLAESYLRANSHQKSDDLANNVEFRIHRSSRQSSITRRFHFRVLTILARNAHERGNWNDAVACWEESLGILDIMQDLGPSTAVVHLSVAHALREQCRNNESIVRAKLAWELLEGKTPRRYHYTGFDSYWRDAIVSNCREWG